MSEYPMTRFFNFLRDKGYLATRQRKAIAEVIFSDHAHLSAEGIQNLLRRKKVEASLATIYRTLDVLIQSGLVVQHRFGKRYKRFESVKQGDHHGHLVCTVCGYIQEFRLEKLDELLAEEAGEHGFYLEDYEIAIFGLCDKCRSRRETA